MSLKARFGKTNNHYKHGMTHSAEYKAWVAMIQRCTNEAHQRFCYYGGRGIHVCDRWKDSFSNFLGDMGQRPSTKHSIDRINNNGNYEPNNCRWATQSEQALNKRPKLVPRIVSRVILACKICKGPMVIKPYRQYTAKYCSRACSNKGRVITSELLAIQNYLEEKSHTRSQISSAHSCQGERTVEATEPQSIEKHQHSEKTSHEED